MSLFSPPPLPPSPPPKPLPPPPPPPDRFFQFDVTVINPKTFLSRTLKAKLKVNDINKFLDPAPSNSVSTQQGYTKPVKEELLKKSTELVYINIDQLPENDVSSIDELNPYLYEIKNKYHLMDPFLTTGSEQKITDDLRKKFEIVLDRKSKEKDTEYHEYTF
jgi:hypothetical protein